MKYARQEPGCDRDRKQVEKLMNSRWREKLLGRIAEPVPQTDTGRRGEKPKMNGITFVKELGKMTP